MCAVWFGLCLGKACIIPDDQVGDCSALSSWFAYDGVPDGNVNPVLSQFSRRCWRRVLCNKQQSALPSP